MFIVNLGEELLVIEKTIRPANHCFGFRSCLSLVLGNKMPPPTMPKAICDRRSTQSLERAVRGYPIYWKRQNCTLLGQRYIPDGKNTYGCDSRQKYAREHRRERSLRVTAEG